MGKLTIDLDDSVERKLRHFISATYLKPHGKIKEVLENAITDYCSPADLARFVDSLHLGEHALLVGSDTESARRVELAFIARNLGKGHNTLVIQRRIGRASAQTILEELRAEGFDEALGASSSLLQVVGVPEQSDFTELPVAPPFGLLSQEPPFAVLIAGGLGSSTDEKFNLRIALDARLHEALDSRTTMMCSYQTILDSRERFASLGTLLQMHTSSIFALVNRNFVLGLHDTSGNAEASKSKAVVARKTPTRGERAA